MLGMEGIKRGTQLYLTSHMVFVVMLLLLFGTSCCYGTSSNSLHATKELLKEAIKEYNTILEYLVRLLHALEMHRSMATTNSSASFHYSTVKRIPYAINVHPILPYQPSAPAIHVSSTVSPLASTTPTTSSVLLFRSMNSQGFTTTIPTVSFNSTTSSLPISTPILLLYPSSPSLLMPTSHITSPSIISTPTVSLTGLMESSPITTTSMAPPSTSITLLSPTASSYKLSAITSTTTLPSLTVSTTQPQTHSPIITTNETHTSLTYPLLSHSSPSTASHSSSVTSNSSKDGMAKDAEEKYSETSSTSGHSTKTTKKEAATVQANVPENYAYTTEQWNTSLKIKENPMKKILVDDEGLVEKKTNKTQSNNYSDEPSLPYQGNTSHSGRHKGEVLKENTSEKRAEIVVDKENLVHIEEERENQDKEATEGEEQDKEKEDIEHKKHKTRSIAEAKENPQNDEVDANKGKQETTGSEKRASKEGEEMKGDEDMIGKKYKIIILKLDNSKHTDKLHEGTNIRNNKNMPNNEDVTGGINETKDEEKGEKKVDDNTRAVSDKDKENKEWLDNNGNNKSTRKNNQKKTSNNRKEGKSEKHESITQKGEIKGNQSLFMKETDGKRRTEEEWEEGTEISEELNKPDKNNTEDLENKGEIDIKLQDRKVDGKRKTDKEEEWGKDTESSKELNKPDKSKTDDLENAKDKISMKIQDRKERNRTEIEEEDEAEPQHDKKMKKIIYSHRESEENEEHSLQVKKIRGMQKPKDIVDGESSYQKETRKEEKDKDEDEKEPLPTKKNKTPPARENEDTNRSQVEKEEYDSNSTAKTPKNNESRKHRGTKAKVMRPRGVLKLRKVRHVVYIPPASTAQPPPYLCTKDMPQNIQHLCAQLFSVLSEVELVTWEVASSEVTRAGIRKLQEKTQTLSEVLEKVIVGTFFFSMVDQQLFVSYLHRLDQIVVKAKQQLESRLVEHDGPSVMLVAALGIGAGLVVLVLLVTVVFVVARRRQVQREEIYRKQVRPEQIPIQCFLDSGHSNPGMREDEPQPQSQSVLWSQPGQDPAGDGGGGGYRVNTEEGHTKSQRTSAFTTTSDSTTANSNPTDSHSHTANSHTIQPDSSTQSHKG